MPYVVWAAVMGEGGERPAARGRAKWKTMNGRVAVGGLGGPVNSG